MSTQIVSLADLSESFTTRRRGGEAYANLSPMLQPDTRIVLNLDGTTVLSTSFLDELLLGLKKDNKINALLFKTSDPRTRSRLERLSGARSLLLRALNSRGVVERIQPRSITPFRPNLVKHKSQPRIFGTADEDENSTVAGVR